MHNQAVFELYTDDNKLRYSRNPEMNQLLLFYMFMTPWESLAPQVLLPEQERYLPYIKKVIKGDTANYKSISLLNLDYKIYTTNS